MSKIINSNIIVLPFTEENELKVSPKADNIMRAFAGRLVDIMLNDAKNARLNFVLQNNTILIGNKLHRVKIIDW